MQHGQWWNDENLLNTLRLSTGESAAILVQLGDARDGGGQAEKRQNRRIRYWRKRLAFRLHGPTGTPQPYAALPANISSGGMSLLHGFFVYTGTSCEVALEPIDGEITVIPGKVVRCRHLRGMTHELGIAFANRIRLPAYVSGLDSSDDVEELDGRPAKFSGRVLAVDDCVEDREYLDFLLTELGVESKTASTSEEALTLLESGAFDVVITRLELPGQAPAAWVKTLRTKGFAGLVAAVATPGPSLTRAAADAQSEAVANGCNCVLSPPITAERLAELFQGVLPQDLGDDSNLEALVSTHWTNVEMQDLILKYVARLSSHIEQLSGLLSQQDHKDFCHACRQLSASAQNYGYPQIASKLGHLEMAVANGAETEDLKGELSELAQLSARARLVQK